MSYETLRTTAADGILTLTLHRPERLNAFNARMHRELLDVFDAANENDDVRVVIVTGEGRAFCAGMDLGGGGGTFDNTKTTSMDDHRDEGGEVVLKIFESKKPVIAAINGAAVGIGATMTLPMDVRLASDTAKLGFVFARRGITAEACSSWFLPKIVGMSQALEWTMTGRVFSAQEALTGRLVSRVLPAAELLSTARALALEIAENTSAISVALNRQLLWKMASAEHPMLAHRIDSKAIYYMGSSPDGAEGVQSFLEKRAPQFKMKVSRDMPAFYPWWIEPSFKP
ncbi:MAG TPA: crotonase/enoyl-CoA hydratase family protein [Polyangiaceae bacterium]|nr:crotonase/enoyl-CoA hydratase family protein [Polyangiaceae bacterium]